ncbi:MAG: chromosomal replication initiator protein DnaA [Ignavibacteriales bacterium]|nr:chromosomal replication initiator protein DnaA [Ignavibacteriales bacterium]
MNPSNLDIKNTQDVNLIWQECLIHIKEQIPPLTYLTWFTPIIPLELTDSTIKVQVPSEFFIDWIEEKYRCVIDNAITNVLGHKYNLSYIVLNTIENEDYENIINSSTEPEKKIQIRLDKPLPAFDTHINIRYTFDSFIKGEGNQLARAAAVAISENPGQTSFNPFFIYAGVGLGKTHLIHAIGNYIIEKFPSKRVIYLPSDLFTVQFVEAIQANKVNDFSSFYKGMDVLIIDDIQDLVGKEKTQDLFFHIFNTLHQSGKQIILSSDKPPKDLKGLNERLISRFQWGLSADMQPPDFETRIAILSNKCKTFGMTLSQDIIEYIAYNVTSNIRELEGCLIKLLADSSFNSRDINLELARKTVNEVATRKNSHVSIDTITKAVCNFFEIAETKLREKNRRKEIALARQIAMYLSKELTNSSLKAIGLNFGGRDHSTVIHAHNLINKLIKEDFTVKSTIEKIKSLI